MRMIMGTIRRPSRMVWLFVAFSLAACSGQQGEQREQAPPIKVYRLQPERVPIYQEFVGQVHGLKDISILARVEGFLQAIHFQEGRLVHKGDLLYTIESQPYEARVAAAMGALAKAETEAANAKSELDRIRPLARIKAVSQRDLDAAQARYQAALASVKAARANLKAARIQLDYTKVRSPITGIIGKTRAKVGDFVGRAPNPVVLNVVSRVDSVLVEFHLPESEYLKFYRALHRKSGAGRTYGAVPLTLTLADGTELPQQGHIKFIDREVDASTGAILVQAEFPNPTGILRPGLFARVRARIRELKHGVLVPQRAVMEVQGRRHVYVVGKDNKLILRTIRTGIAVGDRWLVTEGLKGDETIVYEGLQQVRAGMEITPVEVKRERQQPNSKAAQHG